MAKIRLDALLVKRKLASDRTEAKEQIIAGRVVVQGIKNKNIASQVEAGVDLKILPDDTEKKEQFVSRGAQKLLSGLKAFNINPKDMVAMDVGASTGGFTDVLLQRGAQKVYAIDVGYGQLAWSLRQDSRVIVLERENIRTIDESKIDRSIDLTVIDASFISLTLILGRIATLMKAPAHTPIVALIKPQFEAGQEQVEEGGVVRNPEVHQECIEKVRAWAKARSFGGGEIVQSPLRGPAGNIEFLIHLTTPTMP